MGFLVGFAMRITKSVTFDAAHYLPDVNGTGADDGRYARMHGHSFSLKVTIEGDSDPETGWVADFDNVSLALEHVRSSLDHHLLNEIEGLSRPTLENIAIWVADKLKADFPGLVEVEIARPSNGESCIYPVR